MARRRAKKPPPPTIVTLENERARTEILVRAGGTLGSLRIDGRDLLAAPPVADVEAEYAFRATLDTFPGNLYLVAGFAVPLFPLAGPLPARALGLDLGEADVQGRRVPVPLNLNRQHWHGLAYLKRAEIVSADSARAHLRLPAGFFGPYWTGQVQLDLIYTLNESLRVELKASNLGPTPVPVGAGVRLCLSGDAPYVKHPDGVSRGATRVRAHPVANVDITEALTIGTHPPGEGFVSLEPDACFSFSFEISG